MEERQPGVERDPAQARSVAAQLQGDTTDALEELRDLARGIYPPLLADKGLVAALESQARKSVVPVAEAMVAMGKPFIFATGYGDNQSAPQGFSAPVIRKPYDVTQVAAALAEATGRI